MFSIDATKIISELTPAGTSIGSSLLALIFFLGILVPLVVLIFTSFVIYRRLSSRLREQTIYINDLKTRLNTLEIELSTTTSNTPYLHKTQNNATIYPSIESSKMSSTGTNVPSLVTKQYKSVSAKNEAINSNNDGVKFFSQQNYEKSLECLEKAVYLDPTYALAYYNLADVQLTLGMYPQSIGSLSKSIQLEPNSASYYNRAVAFYKLQDYQNAENDLKSSIKINEFDVDTYNLIGIIQKKQKKYQAAEANFIKAISMSPLDSSIYLNRANLYLHQKMYDLARKDLEMVLQLDSSNAKAREGMEFINRASRL